MNKIAEKDWKKLRAMKDEKLHMACEKIFMKINSIIEQRGGESHKAYLELWQVVHEEDKKIAIMFNDLRRGNAILKLVAWKRNGLLSDSELKEFTKETRERIYSWENI